MYVPEVRSILNRIQHYGEINDDLQKIIDKNIELVNKTIRPKKIFRTFDIELSDNVVSLIGTNIKFNSKDLSELLKKSDKIAIMALTLGRAIDEESLRLQKTDTLDAMVFDGIASEVAEMIAEVLNAEIIESAKKIERYTTRRYSPGYGDLGLSVQEDIIGIFTRYHLGINLTKSNMLAPAKSITAIVGLSVSEEKQEQIDFCATCRIREKCSKKNTGERCGYKE